MTLSTLILKESAETVQVYADGEPVYTYTIDGLNIVHRQTESGYDEMVYELSEYQNPTVYNPSFFLVSGGEYMPSYHKYVYSQGFSEWHYEVVEVYGNLPLAVDVKEYENGTYKRVSSYKYKWKKFE